MARRADDFGAAETLLVEAIRLCSHAGSPDTGIGFGNDIVPHLDFSRPLTGGAFSIEWCRSANCRGPRLPTDDDQKPRRLHRGLLSRTAAPTLLQVSGFSPPIANMFFEDVKFTIFFGLLLANPSYEAELGA